MTDDEPGGDQRLKYALIAALAVIALLLAVLVGIQLGGGDGDSTASDDNLVVGAGPDDGSGDDGSGDDDTDASSDPEDAQGSPPSDDDSDSGGQADSDVIDPTATPRANQGDSAQTSASPTARPQQTAPSPTPTSPTPTSPAPTPTSPAPTPTSPAPTPTSPAPTPTSPAPTPTSPAPTPTSPAPTPTSPAPTPTSPPPTPTPTPTATTPPAQIAPPDARFNNPLNIPLDTTVSVLEFVSHIGGDTTDRSRYSVTGMNPNSSLTGGRARLVIAVSCFGTGTENVEIFTGGQTFECGQTVVDREVTADSDTGTITITAVAGTDTYVQWVLTGTATRAN